MNLEFYKYQGTGNDFVMIDDRDNNFPVDQKILIQRLCNRRFGIGADGLILLRDEKGYDFNMVYFNSDGNPSSMCGNGGRCIVAFANHLGIKKDQYHFLAPDGPHDGYINEHSGDAGILMKDVNCLEKKDDHCFLDTGSPHVVMFNNELEGVDVFKLGREIRNKPAFSPGGTNVNFVEIREGFIKVRTYERGVEDETLSCGTGATASAIAAFSQGFKTVPVRIETPGGILTVDFKHSNGSFYDIWLSGDARLVFKGVIEI